MNVYNADGTLFGTFPKTNALDDSFIIKSDKVTGKVQWVTRIGGTAYDDAYFLDFDTAGNVYITGATNSNPIIFYSTNGTSVSLASASAFLVKYDSNGIVQWATRTVQGDCRSVTVEGSNVYIAGYFTSATITAYDAPGTTSSIPAINRVTSADGYIVKYNSSGQAQWMTSISGGAIQAFQHILTSDSTGIYYVGQYSGPTVTIYDAPGIPSSLSSISIPSGKRASVLIKYSFSGQAVWFTQSVGYLVTTISEGTFFLNAYNNSIFLSFRSSAGGTVSLYDSQNRLQSTITNSDSIDYNSLIRYDQSGNISWSTTYGLGRGISLYNDTLLVQSLASRTSFYDTDGNVVNMYGDELTGNNVFIAIYTLDGKIMNTRKITGNISSTIPTAPRSYQYIGIQTTNSFYRVYDTGSDTKYQTIETGNLGSVYIKVSGATI